MSTSETYIDTAYPSIHGSTFTAFKKRARSGSRPLKKKGTKRRYFKLQDEEIVKLSKIIETMVEKETTSDK